MVAHLRSAYLRLTQNWVHTQVSRHHRYRPIVLAITLRNPEYAAAVECHSISERSWPSRVGNHMIRRALKFYPSHLLVARKREVRLLHAHFGNEGFRAIGLARALRVPLVTTFYGFDASRLPVEDPVWRARYRYLFQHGARFLVEGPHLGRRLVELGCPENKVTIHHLGVECGAYPAAPRAVVDGEQLKILVAARFAEKKGICDAVEAFAGLRRVGMDAHLTIIGDSDEEPATQREKERILAAIRESGVGSFVSLPGTLSHHQLRAAYYQHHIIVSPSVTASDGDSEGGAPVTLIEASATGMPVVATLHADIPEVVVHGETGFLAPERDVAALTRHLAALARSPERIRRMGIAGASRVRASFDADTQGRRLEEIYDSVLSES